MSDYLCGNETNRNNMMRDRDACDISREKVEMHATHSKHNQQATQEHRSPMNHEPHDTTHA